MILPAPTVEEQAWMNDICRIGCCVCIRTGLGPTPGEVHHRLTAGGRKISHRHTLCLCQTHHRADVNNQVATSRHHWRKAFEERYGSEEELMEWTESKVEELRACVVS